jgi:hypothetical protein
MFRLGFILLLISTAALGFQQKTSAADPQPEKDVYAIYSQILTRSETSHGKDDNERYLIEATTAPGYPREPCVRPPKEREAEWREVLADFERRKDTPRQLERAFSIGKSYELLNADEVKEFIEARSVPKIGSRKTNERFHGVTDLFSLSDVYFNRRRTLALTYISTWCGGLCGLMSWKVYEKSDAGEWEERPWVLCTTMSQAPKRPLMERACFDDRRECRFPQPQVLPSGFPHWMVGAQSPYCSSSGIISHPSSISTKMHTMPRACRNWALSAWISSLPLAGSSSPSC